MASDPDIILGFKKNADGDIVLLDHQGEHVCVTDALLGEAVRKRVGAEGQPQVLMAAPSEAKARQAYGVLWKAVRSVAEDRVGSGVVDAAQTVVERVGTRGAGVLRRASRGGRSQKFLMRQRRKAASAEARQEEALAEQEDG